MSEEEAKRKQLIAYINAINENKKNLDRLSSLAATSGVLLGIIVTLVLVLNLLLV